MPDAPHCSDAMRTIAARLCLSDETKLDGQMLLELASQVAALESELAEVRESAGEVLMALNDQQAALTALATKLAHRHNPAPAHARGFPDA